MWCFMNQLLKEDTPPFLEEELFEISVNVPTLNIEQGGRWAFLQVIISSQTLTPSTRNPMTFYFNTQRSFVH